jgi:iron complex outermembrane receptor protein
MIALSSRALGAQSSGCGGRRETVPEVPAQGWAPPLDRLVTIDARDVSLRDALDRLAAAVAVRLTYSADVVPVDARVCASFRSVALGGALGVLLEGAGVEARAVGGDQVVLAPLREVPAQAPRQPTMLERVIVTGSAAGAPERPLSVGVATIRGAQLRGRAITGSIAELLDGVVPGVWAWAQPPASLLVRYASVRGASSFDATYPKVYIDGIEVASPLLVSKIDPETIDRVEVIRGPQGAALYGSDAISGVINIVTRTSGVSEGSPRLSLSATGGTVSSDYAASAVPTQRYSATLRAGSSTRAATLGISAEGTGAYTPGAYGRNVSGVASTRLVGARAIASGTARLAIAEASASDNPVLAQLVFNQTSSGSGSGPIAFTPASTQSSREYTVGTTIRLMQSARLTHSIVVGVDGYRLSGVPPASSPIPSAADAALRDASGAADRGSLRLATVADLGRPAGLATTLTLGAEQSVLRSATVGGLGATPDAVHTVAPARSSALDRGSDDGGGHGGDHLDDVAWRNNLGLIAQFNAAVSDLIYLTAGVRQERNSAFAQGSGWRTLPLLGVALVGGRETYQVKVRAAYGKGIRSPRTASRETMSGSGRGWDDYGHDEIGRRGLAPETQNGIEAGIDLYAGRALALRFTGFDQSASGLIQRVTTNIDSSGRGGYYGPARIEYALENLGAVNNRGWELDGSLTGGPLTLSGSFSQVRSVVTRLDSAYSGDLQQGSRMLEVPAHTGSLTLAWSGNRWVGSVTGARASDWINYDRIALANAVVRNNVPTTSTDTGAWLRGFWRHYDGVTRLRAAIARQLTPTLTLTATGDNLLGYQRGEPDNITIVPGRTLTLGVRASF